MPTWKEYKLGEIVDIKNGKARPKEDGNIPVYGGNGILGYSGKYNVQGENVIIGRVGAYCGAVYYENKPIWISDNALYAKVNNGFKTKFLYYLLKQDNLNQYAGGSSHPLLTQTRLNDLKYTIPDLPTQTAIAEILSSLDDKIELNNQINQELEALAQALFKQWFIDFEFPNENGQPYKSSGGEMVESELGEIPNGWRVGVLDEIVTVKGGTTPSTKEPEFWDGEHHWTSPKDLSNLQFPVLLNTEKRITDLGLKKVSSGLLPKGTLLLSSRAPIGYLAITEIETAINQGYIAINCKNGFSNLFMLYWLKQNMDSVIERANGSTFLEISKTNFREIKIILPKQEIHNSYIKEAELLFKLLVENIKENEELKSLRDKLLPKLISGELEVSEALTEAAM